MRAFQLCSIAHDLLGDRYDFATQAVPNLRRLRIEGPWLALQPRGTVFILVKDAVDRFSPDGLLALQERAAGVALDHIDRHLHIMPRRGIDLHVSASVSGVAAMSDRIAEVTGGPDAISGEVARLLHGVDLRVHQLPRATYDALRPVYFGAPHVTTIPAAIAHQIPVLDATTTQKMEANYRAVAGYNLHYGIRRIVKYPHIRGRKPFTKGFTAGVLGANILTHADEDDALPLLGPDYPYMADSTEEAKILETWARVQREFGGPMWRKAADAMEQLSTLVSIPAQAAELDAILRRLLV